MRSLPNTGYDQSQSQKIKKVINSHHIALPVRNGCADSWLANCDLDDAHGYALILVALGVAKRELETLPR